MNDKNYAEKDNMILVSQKHVIMGMCLILLTSSLTPLKARHDASAVVVSCAMSAKVLGFCAFIAGIVYACSKLSVNMQRAHIEYERNCIKGAQRKQPKIVIINKQPQLIVD